jgi:ribulose-phosphate 3-epimerase
MGPVVVKGLRPLADETGALLDVHLMIEKPDKYLSAFAAAGADRLTVHVEATADPQGTVRAIKELGVKAGVTLKPATPLSALEAVLTEVDLVLVMSVDPGFGGQRYIPASTGRIARLRQMLEAMDSEAWLEVDGGIIPGNAAEVAGAGADVLVAGSAVFGGPNSIAENVAAFREALGGS